MSRIQNTAHDVIVWAEEENPYFSGSHRCGCPLSRPPQHVESCVIGRLRAATYGPRGSDQATATELMLRQLVAQQESRLGPMEVDQE